MVSGECFRNVTKISKVEQKSIRPGLHKSLDLSCRIERSGNGAEYQGMIEGHDQCAPAGIKNPLQPNSFAPGAQALFPSRVKRYNDGKCRLTYRDCQLSS